MTTAAVGVFAATTSVGDEAGSALVVAATDLRAGQVIEPDDVAVARGVLPAGSVGFASVDEIVGRAALGPVADGEVIQPGSVTGDRAADTARREVALTLPRDHLAVGRLRAGDRVDVFVTYDDQTAAVVQGAEVLHLAARGDGSLTTDREVELVVAIESGELVAALVHALRTGDVTVVRSTFAEEQADGLTHQGSSTSAEPGAS